MFEFEGRSLKYKESNCLEKRGRRELSVAVGPVANVFDASHENILFCFFFFIFVCSYCIGILVDRTWLYCLEHALTRKLNHL